MACIVCFLDDEYQEKLRRFSQLKGERFEESINEYKNLFLAEFNYLKNVKECEEHNILNNKTIDWLNNLHETLIKVKNKHSFFDLIIKAYIQWVSGNTVNAINSLEKTIKNYDILVHKFEVNSKIFFRGRKSKKLLSKEDLYHIPFNKRHLVSNQRYSLTGQPMFYFGLSVLNVLTELRQPINSFEDVHLSCFINTDNSLRIYDFTNPFQSQIGSLDRITKSVEDAKIDYFDTYYGNNMENHPKEFYKFIFLCVCSFKRNNENTNFVEEYVIPQMLTEITRKNKFDGILFSSTRINKDIAYSTDTLNFGKYKENLVLFTEYNKDGKFDFDLIEKFIVSKPIRETDFIEIKFNEIEKLSSQIVKLNEQKKYFKTIKQMAELTGISHETHFRDIMVKNTNDEYIKYFDHRIGKIHNYILYTQLLNIRNILNNK